MSNRRLQVYRQVLYQMQQGMSDRAIALGGTMGRRKAAQLRCKAVTEGWLEPGAKLPDDAALAAVFLKPAQTSSSPVSTLEQRSIGYAIVPIKWRGKDRVIGRLASLKKLLQNDPCKPL